LNEIDDDDDDVPRSKAISLGILQVLVFKLEVIVTKNVTKRNNSNTIIEC